MVHIEVVMKIIELGRGFRNCPVAWQNMVDQLDKDKTIGATVESINAILAEFDAVYIVPGSGPTGKSCLQFNTDAGHLMFLLKYS